MAADIKKLISQLRKQVPAVNHNPLLDEIESAYDDEEKGEGDEEASEGADAPGEGPSEADAYGAPDAEDAQDGGADDSEESDAPPPPKGKGAPFGKSSKPMPKMSKTKPFM